MKKQYQKPSLYVESFVLSQAVAENCHLHEDTLTLGKPTSGDVYSCGWDDGVGEITWTANGKCTQIVEADADIGIGCYHSPSGLNSLFALS